MNPRGQILIIQNDPWLKDATLKLFLTLFCHHFTRNSKIFPDAQKLHNQIKEGLFSTLMRNKYYLFLVFFMKLFYKIWNLQGEDPTFYVYWKEDEVFPLHAFP